VARSVVAGNYEAVTEIAGVEAGASAGIAAIGDTANACGVAFGGGKVVQWRRDKGEHRQLVELDAPKGKGMRLRVTAVGGRTFKFAMSASGQGKEWIPIGDTLEGDKLPPWDRGIRIGLTAGGNGNARFGMFRMEAKGE
jgi:hypothetical protein